MSARKDEQYRLMFTELEKFVISHSSNSPRHHQVLECLMQVCTGCPIITGCPNNNVFVIG